MISVRAIPFLFLISVLTFSGCDTKNDFEDLSKKYFIKYYGEDGKQQGVDMIVNYDGTMILLGNTISAGDDSSRIFLVKVDREGNVLWQKNFGDNGEHATDIERTLESDSSFVVLSNIFLGKDPATGADKHDIHLIKISQDGEVVDSKDKSFHIFGSQYGNTVTRVSSDNVPPMGGYIVSGYTTEIIDAIEQEGVRSTDLLTILIDNDITDPPLWTSRVTNQLDGEAITVIESKTYDATNGDPNYKDRPFYMFGYSDVNTIGDVHYENNFWCASLNENGINSFDSYSGDTSKVESMSQTIRTGNSRFISVGTQISSTNQKSIILVASETTDATGLRFLSQPVVVRESQNLEAVSITQSVAGGRYLIVSNETNLAGTTNIWLSKVDSEGFPQLSASFGAATRNDYAAAVRELEDGTIVILGTVELDSQNSKMTLIKVNANGQFLD